MAAFDVVVLGGGTAGVHVATEVAGGGKKVALVEAGLIGGESAYLACLPSNSLLLSAARGEPWEDAVARRTEVTGGLDDSAPAQRLNRAGVQVIRGTGRITAPGTVVVTLLSGGLGGVVLPQGGSGGMGPPGREGASRALARNADKPEGTTTTLTYSDLVIATGCEPVAPPIEGLSDIPAWTTAQSLSSRDLPRRLIVLGGGPAGCELTQVYASFGSQVTLVEAEPRLLPGEPAFAGEILAVALRRAGAEIRLGSRATKAERTADGLTLALEDGTRIDAARLLLATGRRPRLGGLGLDVLGLEVTPGMALPTTTRCEVAGTGGQGVRVWAAGDVTGTTHTHASHYQAGVVAANILGRHREADYSAIPRCVFTTPSVFAVGAIPGAAEGGPAAAEAASPDHGPGNGAKVRRMLRIARAPSNQTEAAETPAQGGAPPAQGGAGPRLITARVRLGDTARGYLGQDDLGCVELYADTGTGALAGAVAVGPDATSWMGEITLAIRAKIPVAVLADVVHAFPTYGEALQTALRELAGTEGSAARADQQEKGTGTLSELDMETPEGDAIEQHQEVIADEAVASARREVPFDVNEADAAEQERAVGFDDDDYR